VPATQVATEMCLVLILGLGVPQGLKCMSIFYTAKLTVKLLYHLSLVLAQDDMDLAKSQAYCPCSY